MTVVDASRLEEFAATVLQRAGLSTADADIVASSLVAADLRGISSHGVARLHLYLRRVTDGVMKAVAEPMVVTEFASVATLDAGNGFGQVAARKAMEIAIEKAAITGAGAVSVMNSNHFGIAGFYAEQAAAAHLIGIVMTNSSPAMAPFSSTQPLLGTNPMAVGVPAGQHGPIVLDMSSSMVARGKIRSAHRRGQTTIPADWAYDSGGRPTTDPATALEGLLAPIGGAKGAGLALVIHLLAGTLSGSVAEHDVANINDVSRPSGTGHLMIALDPGAFIGRERFEREVGRMVERIHSLPPVEGTNVYVPGELEQQSTSRNLDDGIELDPTVLDELTALATTYDVEAPFAQSSAS